ncbi:sarcosine oxidase subunit alpha family protein (plasmid) [Cupriavidus basilensis]
MKPLERLPVGDRANSGSARPVNFTFDGKAMVGREGDTLAAALLANGVSIVGRSFKLHRPRGVMGSGLEETNAFVQLEAGGFAEPNVRATLQPLYEGLSATSQNAWPNVQWDALGILDAFQRVLPASFYYKSMMWPNWHFYERFVRPIAGLGKAPEARDAQTYQKRNLHCDVLIVGSGPAGLSAARVAGQSGLRVVLIDDREEFGGSLQGDSYTLGGAPALSWVSELVHALSALPNVQLLPRTTVSGYYENNFLVAAQRLANHLGPRGQKGKLRERLWRIRAKRVILATGAIERPLVFPGNDTPGIMLASALRYYLNKFGIAAGKQIVVATNNDDAYRTAFDLHAAGVRNIVVMDTRGSIGDTLRHQVKQRDIALHEGFAIRTVKGRRKLKAIEISNHLGNGRLGNESRTIACDLLAMSSGWTPTIHLYSQAGGNLRYDPKQACLVPEKCAQLVRVAGSANGTFSLQSCLAEGHAIAAETVQELGGKPVAATPEYALSADEGLRIEPYWYTQGVRTDKQWLDFQYDVKVSDIELAVQENFVSVEHVKRYTTGGMSIDQGKSSNFNILAVMAELLEKKIPEVGTTRFRPPFQPVTIGSFAGPTIGERYAPWRTLPAQAWHDSRCASFGDYGWKRPDFYPRDGENIATATLREVLAVRKNVGMFDGSPLGKLEVRGPDAAAFLNRVYVNNLSTLKPQYARYAMLTNENGVLIDDGVVVRLADDHFLVHATSAAVDRVFLLLEELLQCEWPHLKVHVLNVTTQWANVTVSGPRARQVLQRLDSDIDFSKDAFPHMQFRNGTIRGVACRVLRASFTGEVTYEISAPARYAASLWQAVAAAGEEFGITPYGIEALEVMRTEKGYLHIGSDTDGSSNPLDIGWGKIIDKKTDDFIGRRSLQRPADRNTQRLQFVGLESVDPKIALPVGGHMIGDARPRFPVKTQGYVTSSCISPMLNKGIGLGILENGANRLGETVHVYAKGKVIAAKVVPTAHFDPEGERLNG